jgi:outer membrane receptor protein involved in Fe transport
MTLLWAGASTIFLAAGPAWAQQTSAAPEDTAADRDVVVITANRREETVQQSSISVTAISGAQLTDTGVSDYDSLVRTVPGVIASGGASINKLTVRGIETSQSTSSIGNQRAVAIYLDDLPLTSFSVVTPDVMPYDIARVEVLRGPQGTLFGSGSLAGAVRYITNKPDLTDFQASLDIDGGVDADNNYRRRVGAMVNLPLAEDQLALRVSGTYKNDDGFVENVFPGVGTSNSQEDWGIRATLRWQPTDDFSATLTGSHNDNQGGGIPFYDPAVGFLKSSEDQPFAVAAKLATVNLTLDYDLQFADLTSSTSYATSPTDWNLQLDAIIPGVPLHLREVLDTKTVLQELRLVSKPSDSFDWVAGAFYLDQTTDQQDILYFTTPFINALNIVGLPTNLAPGSAYSNDISTKENAEAAVFGEINYHISDTLKLTAGVRVTDAEFTARTTGEGAAVPDIFTPLFTAILGFGGSTVSLAPATPSESTTNDDLRITPKFVLTWQPTDDQTYYLSASEGFRRGQPNGVAAANGGQSLINPLDPAIIPVSAAGDSLWNYEAGAKLNLFDDRVQANFAAYLIKWADMQIPLVRTSDQVPYAGNIGEAESVGLEGEIVARASDLIDLGFNFQVQNSEVTQISADQALISGALLGSSLASPDLKLGLFGKATWLLGDGSEVVARIDAQHVGSYANGFPSTPGAGTLSPTFATIPSYEKVDASVGWRGDDIGVTLYVDNLLDEDSPIFINPANFSANRYSALRPRTVGVRLSYVY